MALQIKRLTTKAAIGLILLCTVICGLQHPLSASDPHSARYSTDSQKIFWFVLVSDTHIGAAGFPDSDHLIWLTTEAKEVISPAFIVNAGDLTDGTLWDALGYPNGPHAEEWRTYHDIVTGNGMDASFYYDLPGNHDHFGDKKFTNYLVYSVQGAATGQTQFSWNRTFDFGSYHFLGINTCGNDGADFSMLPPCYGDNAGLDEAELQFIEEDLEAHKDADLTMIFGHHLLVKRETDWTYVTGDSLEDMTMTALAYGADEFISLMETYQPLMYAYGHSHVYHEEFLTKDMTEGVFYLNVASMTKNETQNYNIIAIDNNGISTTAQTIGLWPAVTITAPLDKNLGMSNNPYTSDIVDDSGSSTPIRALVFDKNPVTKVEYRMYKLIDDVGTVVGDAVNDVTGNIDNDAMWVPMTQVPADHSSYPYLWTADCPNPLAGGDYSIEVRAVGSRIGKDSVPTSFPADAVDDKGQCFITALWL